VRMTQRCKMIFDLIVAAAVVAAYYLITMALIERF
jgi:hypothetical protein